jgi:hypothetical protein
LTGRRGDLVIIPIVDGTFSVSWVGDTHVGCTIVDGTFSVSSVEDTHVGCTDSEQEALALALRHRRGGQIWRIEPGGMVAVDCPQADLGEM